MSVDRYDGAYAWPCAVAGELELYPRMMLWQGSLNYTPAWTVCTCVGAANRPGAMRQTMEEGYRARIRAQSGGTEGTRRGDGGGTKWDPEVSQRGCTQRAHTGAWRGSCEPGFLGSCVFCQAPCSQPQLHNRDCCIPQGGGGVTSRGARSPPHASYCMHRISCTSLHDAFTTTSCMTLPCMRSRSLPWYTPLLVSARNHTSALHPNSKRTACFLRCAASPHGCTCRVPARVPAAHMPPVCWVTVHLRWSALKRPRVVSSGLLGAVDPQPQSLAQLPSSPTSELLPIVILATL